MRHPIEIPHAGAPQVELSRSLLTGRARVYVNGCTVEPRKPGSYWVPLSDGSTIPLVIGRASLDGAEFVTIDGVPRWLARRLRWYETGVAFLPLAMIVGGAIFAGVGAGALATNLIIVRARLGVGSRLLACTAVFLGAVGVALAISALVVR
jgi:hypothetical protein